MWQAGWRWWEFQLGRDNGGPHGIAVDYKGNVYVVDTGNNRIYKFSSDGSFMVKSSSFGSDDGQFNNPTGVAIDRFGDVYVAVMFFVTIYGL